VRQVLDRRPGWQHAIETLWGNHAGTFIEQAIARSFAKGPSVEADKKSEPVRFDLGFYENLVDAEYPPTDPGRYPAYPDSNATFVSCASPQHSPRHPEAEDHKSRNYCEAGYLPD
jgi:hypothetical protein